MSFLCYCRILLERNFILAPYLHQNVFDRLDQRLEIEIGRKGQPLILDKPPQDFNAIEFG